MVDANLLLLHRNPSKTRPQSDIPLSTSQKSIFKYLKSNNLQSALNIFCSVVSSSPLDNFSQDSQSRLFICTSIKSFSDILSSSLDSEDLNHTIDILKQLEKLLDLLPSNLYAPQKCDILNILACAHKKSGKTQAAKKCLEIALDLVSYVREPNTDVASIYLNMCAILSNLNRHKDALDYGRIAVKIAQEVFSKIQNLTGRKERNDLITILGVGYHNLGVEEEHLKNYSQSLHWYKQAVKFLKNHGDSKQTVLLKEFKKSYRGICKIITQNKKTSKADKVTKRPRSGSMPSSHKSSLSSASRVPSTKEFQNPKMKDFYQRENTAQLLDTYQLKMQESSRSSIEALDSDTEADIQELAKLGFLDNSEHVQTLSKSSANYLSSKSSANFLKHKAGSNPTVKLRYSSSSKISTPALSEDNYLGNSFKNTYYIPEASEKVRTIPIHQIQGNQIMRAYETASRDEKYENKDRYRYRDDSDIEIVGRVETRRTVSKDSLEKSYSYAIEKLPEINQKTLIQPTKLQDHKTTIRAKNIDKEQLKRIQKKETNPVVITSILDIERNKQEDEEAEKIETDVRVKIASDNYRPQSTISITDVPELISNPQDKALTISYLNPQPNPSKPTSPKSKPYTELYTQQSQEIPNGEYVKNLVHSYTINKISHRLTLTSQDSLRTEIPTVRSPKPVIPFDRLTLQSAALKIQKVFRGYQARHKFLLLKKNLHNQKLIYRCGRKLGDILGIVSVYSYGNKYLISMVDSCNSHSQHNLELNDSSQIDPKYICNQLNYDSHHGLYLTSNLVKGEEGDSDLKIIKRHMKTIQKETYILTFYISSQSQIFVKALKSSTKEEISGWLNGSYQHLSEEELLYDLEYNIIPNIDILNSTLTLKPALSASDLPKYSQSCQITIQNTPQFKNLNSPLILKKKLSITTGDLLVKGERYIDKFRYMIYIYRQENTQTDLNTIDKNRKTLNLRIEATPFGKAVQPKAGLYSIGEVCEIMDLWEVGDVMSNPMEILCYVGIKEQNVILIKSKESTHKGKKVMHICSKVIDGIKLQLSIYELDEESTDGDILIQAEKVENQDPINPLLLFKHEIASNLEISIVDLPQYWDEAASLIILEDISNLGIRKRKLNQNPAIFISPIEPSDSPVSFKCIPQIDTQTQAAIKIQKQIRAKLARDKFQLLKLSREKRRFKKMLYKSGKLIDKRPYIITLYQISKGTLIEAIDQITDKLYEKLLTDPSQFIFGFNKSKDPKLIVDAISIKNGHIEFYAKQSEFPQIKSLTVKSIKNELPSSSLSSNPHIHLSIPSQPEDDKAQEKLPDTPLFSPSKKLLYSSIKTLENEDWSVSIFQETFSYLIEAYKLNINLGIEVLSKRFNEQELKEQYGAFIYAEIIFQDVVIEGNEICIKGGFSKAGSKNLIERSETGSLIVLKSIQDDPYHDYCEEITLLTMNKTVKEESYTVIMNMRKKRGTLVDEYSAEDLLIFEAHSPSQPDEMSSVSIDLHSASSLAGLDIDYIIPIGRHIITSLLIFSSQGISINHNGPPVDLDFAITKLQKIIRGKLVRNKVKIPVYKEPRLIGMSYRKISGHKFLFYAYLQNKRIRLEGSSCDINLSMYLDTELVEGCLPKISRKMYIEKILIPSLYITGQNGVRRLSIDTAVLSKLKGKILNGENTQGIESIRLEPENFIELPKPDSNVHIESYTIQEPESKPKLFHSWKRPTSSKQSNYPEQDSSILRSQIINRELERSHSSLFKNPRQSSQKHNPQDQSLSRSRYSKRPISAISNKTSNLTSDSVMQISSIPTEESNLIYRDSLVISKRKMIISVFRNSKGLVIHGEDMYHELALTKQIRLNIEQNFDERSLNKKCEELISKLILVKNSKGKVVLEVNESSTNPPKILYKKSHYISEKFCIVTIYESDGGIVIQAYRPDYKSTHALSLGIKNRTSKELLGILKGLVKHLKIVNVLGSDNLVYVP